MPNGKNQPDEISIEWEYDKDYRLVPANGMWGGITPRGDLRIDFFVEVAPVPGSGETAFLKDESGLIYKEGRRTPKKETLVRKIQVGVMIPPQQILSFAEWFKDKAQKARVVQESPSKKVN